MIATIKPNWKLAIALPLFIFIACFCITLSNTYKANQAFLSNAIIIDLLITAPLAYFFVIRKTHVSKTTVIRVFVIGLLFAGFILSKQSNSLLHFLKTWVSPLVEALVIFLVVRKFRIASKQAKQQSNNSIDFLPYCRTMMQQVTGHEKAGNLIASEMAVFYYAFAGRKDRTVDYKSKFTSHKENGVLLVLWAIISLFLIETIGIHFLLMLWNKTFAWIIFGLSFYTCLQVFAHIKAVKARPITINKNSLEIHNGLAGDAIISFDNIEKVELNNKLPKDRDAIKIALLKGLENHNCIIYLKHPINVTKVFGIKKQTDTVLFFVDRPTIFLEQLERRLDTTLS